MPTIQQLVRKGRESKTTKTKTQTKTKPDSHYDPDSLFMKVPK